MNLYVTRRPAEGLGHMCRNTNVELSDAEGKTVGFVTPEVADWLVRSGVAMDVSTPKE